MTRMYTQHARRPLFLEKGALPAIVITLSSMAFFHQDFNLVQEVDHAADNHVLLAHQFFEAVDILAHRSGQSTY